MFSLLGFLVMSLAQRVITDFDLRSNLIDDPCSNLLNDQTCYGGVFALMSVLKQESKSPLSPPSPMITRSLIQIYLYHTFNNRCRQKEQKSRCRARSLMTEPEATVVRKTPLRLHEKETLRGKGNPAFSERLCALCFTSIQEHCVERVFESFQLRYKYAMR